MPATRKRISPHARTTIEALAKHMGVSYDTALARVKANPKRYGMEGHLKGHTPTRGVMGGRHRRRTRRRS